MVTFYFKKVKNVFFINYIFINIEKLNYIKIMKKLNLNVQTLSIEDQKSIDGGIGIIIDLKDLFTGTGPYNPEPPLN